MRRTRSDRFATETELTLIGGMHAGENLDERGFPGAVLAEERMDLAGANGEVHRRERHHAREALADAAELEEFAHAGALL